MILTNEQLIEIEGALNAATPGEWDFKRDVYSKSAPPGTIADVYRKEDAFLFANAPRWMRQLLASHMEQAEIISSLKQGIRNSLAAASQYDAYHLLTVLLQEHAEPWGNLAAKKTANSGMCGVCNHHVHIDHTQIGRWEADGSMTSYHMACEGRAAVMGPCVDCGLHRAVCNECKEVGSHGTD